MFKRSKPQRLQNTSLSAATYNGFKVAEDNRCIEARSSLQPFSKEKPTFASVHRTNRCAGWKRIHGHANDSVIGIIVNNLQKPRTQSTVGLKMQRPNYHTQRQQQQQVKMMNTSKEQLTTEFQLQQSRLQQQSEISTKYKNTSYQHKQKNVNCDKQQHQHLASSRSEQSKASEFNTLHMSCDTAQQSNATCSFKHIGYLSQNSRISHISTQQQTQSQHHQQKQHATDMTQSPSGHLQSLQYRPVFSNNTHHLHDIYERNLLAQTIFIEQNQHHKKQRYQSPICTPSAITKKYSLTHNISKSVQATVSADNGTLSFFNQQFSAYNYPMQHFKFSEVLYNSASNRKISSSIHTRKPLSPPSSPSPTSLNHVYETINERASIRPFAPQLSAPTPLPPPAFPELPALPPPPTHLRQIVNYDLPLSTSSPSPPLPPLPPPIRVLKSKHSFNTTNAPSSVDNTQKTNRKSLSNDKDSDRDKDKKSYMKLMTVANPKHIITVKLPANSYVKNNHHPTLFQKVFNPQQGRTKSNVESNTLNQQQMSLGKHLSGILETKVIKPINANVDGIPNNNINNIQKNKLQQDNSSHISSTVKLTDDRKEFALVCQTPLSVEYSLHQDGSLSCRSKYSNTAATTYPDSSNNSNNKYGNSNSNSQASSREQQKSSLPIIFEEQLGDFQDVLLIDEAGTAKLLYRHGKVVEVRLETAQAMAAAAYYAKAAQKLAQSTTAKASHADSMMATQSITARSGGYCGALQKAPPAMPSNLSRRLANKDNYGIGKVKVMLRIADVAVAENNGQSSHYMTVDKKKRQVTLTDPSTATTASATTSQERSPMVAAPKMFAFDNLFTPEDSQYDVCASALSEVVPAVLEGSDGCLLTIGYPNSGQTKTMLGAVNPPSELGSIPCAISWLYKGINERRQKSGARFSVRVSALGISANRPDSTSTDLLAAHATESDDSPGVYLRENFLGGPTELRAPTAERAALFLDAALAGRIQGTPEPAMIFTLHVYQYSLSRNGGVAGGRSRLHLIDLGSCANRNGGLPLSGIGNILLAILSGQRHPPNKDHPLTPLLKDCLGPLTCHVAIMAHVMHKQSHTDALTTIQLASRIHRMRRRKHRFPLGNNGTNSAIGIDKSAVNLNGHQSTGSSGADPSSSELSADTVIYMGPSGEATDGEHPPIYLGSLIHHVDITAFVNKTAKTTIGDKLPQLSNSPSKSVRYQVNLRNASQRSPIAGHTSYRNHLNQANNISAPHTNANESPKQFFSVHQDSKANFSQTQLSPLRHSSVTAMCSKASNIPTPKGSPLRRSGVGASTSDHAGRQISEEHWVDGPRVSRAKVAEARHLLREVNHVKQCETWIDGPKSQSSRSLTTGNLPIASSQMQGYGFMDSHKKSMIRQWVEYQTSQVFQSVSAGSSPTRNYREQQAQHFRNVTYHMSQLKPKSSVNPEELCAINTKQEQHQQQQQQQHQQLPNIPNIQLASKDSAALFSVKFKSTSINDNNEDDHNDLFSTHLFQTHTENYNIVNNQQHYVYLPSVSVSDVLPIQKPNANTHLNVNNMECDEDQDSGPSEVPPALPLIEPLGSREVSHESLHRILSHQVSRETLYNRHQQFTEIQCQDQQRQPLYHNHQLSHATAHHSHNSHHNIGVSDCGLQVSEEDIERTMANSEHPLAALSNCENISVISSLNVAGDTFSECVIGENTRSQFDQLARLREIFTSQLAMAEVAPVFRSTNCDVASAYSEPAFRFITGPGSVCSEPAYRAPSPRQLSRSPSQGSLPSLSGIMHIAGMEQYASLRHPDGASDPNLSRFEHCEHNQDQINKQMPTEHDNLLVQIDDKTLNLQNGNYQNEQNADNNLVIISEVNTATHSLANQSQLPLLPLNTCSEAYDSGHDSSTPRTSKHSGISRRAESGYHSVATGRDSDESSFTSALSKEHQCHHHHHLNEIHNRIIIKKKKPDKGLCTWLMNPFTCTYPETEGEISDF